MQILSNSNHLSHGVHAHERASVRIVAVGEDPSCTKKAREIYGWLVPQFGSECDFHFSGWNAEELTQKEAYSAALFEAAEADMVVVAFRSGSALPGFVQNWVNASLGSGEQLGRMLITLWGTSGTVSGNAAEPPAGHHLHEMARLRGVEYLSRSFVVSENETSPVNGVKPLPAPPVYHPPYTQYVPDGRVEGWGINE